MFEEARVLLSAIKAAYPENFEYFLQATIYPVKSDDEQRALSVDAFDVKDLKNLVYYKNNIQDKIHTFKEASRFTNLGFETFRVVCIHDEIPPGMPPEVFDEDNWIAKGEIYQCYSVKVSMSTNETFLSLRTLDKGQELVPPSPIVGYSSWRFQIADYTKLN